MAGSASVVSKWSSLEKSGLNDICLVLDLDGFSSSIQGFIPREMGFSVVHDPKDYGSYHYHPWVPYKELTKKEKQTARYVQKYIHGMTYYPQDHKGRSYRQLFQDIHQLYDRSKTTNRLYVAYKGGTIEKELLTKMKIPCLNLELFGCPKFDSLLKLCSVGTCGHHYDPFKHHCPKVECYHFAQWIRCQLQLPFDQCYTNTRRLQTFLSF